MTKRQSFALAAIFVYSLARGKKTTEHYKIKTVNQTKFSFVPIRRTTQIRVMTRHHYGISALLLQTPFRGKTSGVMKCQQFLGTFYPDLFSTFYRNG